MHLLSGDVIKIALFCLGWAEHGPRAFGPGAVMGQLWALVVVMRDQAGRGTLPGVALWESGVCGVKRQGSAVRTR